MTSPLHKLPSPLSQISNDNVHEAKTLLRLNPELNIALQNIFPPTSPLDTNDINVVDYINLIFPNEQSIAHASKAIDGLHIKMKKIDQDSLILLKELSQEGNLEVEREIMLVKEAMNVFKILN
jgi:hypothetical protein